MDTRRSVLRVLIIVWILIIFMAPALAIAQDQEDDEKIWAAFTAWIGTNPEKVSLRVYEEKLAEDGLPQDEIKRHIATIRRLFKEHPEKSIEFSYDRIYAKPLTGDPKKDNFTSTPSVFMMESIKDLILGNPCDLPDSRHEGHIRILDRAL